MALPDSTAAAQLGEQAFAVAWLAWLDFDGDPVRVATAPKSLAFTATGDAELDGYTFIAVDPTLVGVTAIRNGEGGAETLSFTLSGIVGPDTDLLNILGDRSLWQGRAARMWAVIYDEAGVQQGAVWPVYTGRMSACQLIGDPSQQTVKVDVESYLASLKEPSGRTYLDQAAFDPVDITARLKVGVANGSKTGVNPIPPSYGERRSWWEPPF